MKHYIGCKLVEAEPALRINGEVVQQEEDYIDIPPEATVEEGYCVRYPDGYESWSPKKVFEKSYFQVDDSVVQGEKNVSRRMVDEFVSHMQVFIAPAMEPHIVRLVCTLRNGTILSEKFDCVDPDAFSEEFGEKICWMKIQKYIEAYLDFLIKMGKNGIQ